jgi:hypothetical protein
MLEELSMDDKNNRWVTALVVMCTGLFAYFHFSTQTMVGTPQMKPPPVISAIGAQSYPARLWEDPIGATERSVRKSGKSSSLN